MSTTHMLMVMFSIAAFCTDMYVNAKVLQQKTSKGQIIFSLIMGSIVISAVGGILKLMAVNEHSMLNAIKIEYVGRVTCAAMIPFFICEYFHVKSHRKLFAGVFAVFMGFLLAIVFAEYHTLFYKEYGIDLTGCYPLFTRTPGILYYVYYFLVGFVFLYVAILAFIPILKSKDKVETIRYFYICAGAVIPLIVALILNGVARSDFDFFTVVSWIPGVMCYIAIKKYQMFDFQQNAKEFILDNVGEAVVIASPKNNVLYFNRAMFSMYPEIQLDRGLPDFILKKMEQGNHVYEENNSVYEFHTTDILRKDGSIEGKLIEITDVTAQKEEMDEIDRLTQEADVANLKKSAFLANMSHEIRTPINAILGMDEMILREAKESHVIEYAQNVQESGENLLYLVNDILDYSKMESGKMETIQARYETKSFLKKLHKEISTRIKSEDITMELKVDESFPSALYGDENKVVQLLYLLMNNGVHFCCKDHTTLCINLEKTQDKIDDYPKAIMNIQIKESGETIRDYNILNAQEVFENGQGEQSGYNLQLGITLHLRELLGVGMEVNQTPEGPDISFSFSQGIADETPIGEAISINLSKIVEEKSVLKIPNAKLLVVDDNLVNLKVIVALLKQTEAKVVTATSGMECLEKIKDTRFDIIFMDHLMPEMDGIETLHKMQEDTNHQCVEVPVIALTANAISGAKEMYMKEGFSDYLVKPIKGASLEEMIRNYLSEELK